MEQYRSVWADFLVIYDPGKRKRPCTAKTLVDGHKWTGAQAISPARLKLEMAPERTHSHSKVLVERLKCGTLES
jgi:hypothetical protein